MNHYKIVYIVYNIIGGGFIYSKLYTTKLYTTKLLKSTMYTVKIIYYKYIFWYHHSKSMIWYHVT